MTVDRRIMKLIPRKIPREDGRKGVLCRGDQEWLCAKLIEELYSGSTRKRGQTWWDFKQDTGCMALLQFLEYSVWTDLRDHQVQRCHTSDESTEGQSGRWQGDTVVATEFELEPRPESKYLSPSSTSFCYRPFRIPQLAHPFAKAILSFNTGDLNDGYPVVKRKRN